MEISPLRGDAPLDAYIEQADLLLARWHSGDASATQIIRARHPRFLDDTIPWLQRRITEAEARAIVIASDDARLALARWYDFYDWASLEQHAKAVAEPGPVQRFERAVEAIISGDAPALRELLRQDPELVRERSMRGSADDRDHSRQPRSGTRTRTARPPR